MKKRFFPMLFLLLLALILPFSLGTLEAEAAAKEQTGFPDPGYTFNSIDGTKVSTKATEGKNHPHYIRLNHMQQNKRNHPQHSREHLGR